MQSTVAVAIVLSSSFYDTWLPSLHQCNIMLNQDLYMNITWKPMTGPTPYTYWDPPSKSIAEIDILLSVEQFVITELLALGSWTLSVSCEQVSVPVFRCNEDWRKLLQTYTDSVGGVGGPQIDAASLLQLI